MSGEMMDGPARGSCNQSGCPELREVIRGKPGAADSLVKRAPQKVELDPGGDSGRNGETGDTPARLDPKHTGQREGAKIAKNNRQDNAHDGKTQGRACIAQCVIGG